MEETKEKIIVIEDEKKMAEAIKIYFEARNYYVYLAYNGFSGLKLVDQLNPSCVITDLKMDKMDGIEVLERVKMVNPDLPVILITAYGTVATAKQALKLGVYDYIEKPFDIAKLKKLVDEACRMYNLVSYTIKSKEDAIIKNFAGVIGKTPQMRKIFDIIKDVADTTSNVLITGQSGTGKELIAKALHFGSSRSKAPFVIVNCAAVPEDLLESELFGYEKGAFTGALQSKPGLFELADGGTLFLDEISEMSQRLQAKLLNAIQDKEIRRLGSTSSKKIDVRYIATSNRNLQEEIKAKRFREDLFYRLNVVSIEVPPLRERKEDIPLLISFFMKKFNNRFNKDIKRIAPEALEVFMGYNYPGNVRELENMIERAVVLTKTDTIKLDVIPLAEKVTTTFDGTEWLSKKLYIPLKNGFTKLESEFEELEKELLKRVIQLKKGASNEEIADYLGTNRRILELRLKKYNITKEK